VELTTGEVIPADTVIVSVGDMPDLDFLPESVAVERGFIRVNELNQTTDSRIFAVGDAVKLGLLTDAIGAGRRVARVISDLLSGKQPGVRTPGKIDLSRIKLEYYDPRVLHMEGVQQCASQCSSCGSCRDCGICTAICPESAISKWEEDGRFEMRVDPDRCIGCGFCAGACPCGIWNLVENDPLE